MSGEKKNEALKAYGLVFGLFGLLVVDLAVILGVMSLVFGPRFFQDFRSGTLSHGQTVLYICILYFMVLATITIYWKHFSKENAAAAGLCINSRSLPGFLQGALLGMIAFTVYFGTLVLAGRASLTPLPGSMPQAINGGFLAHLLLDSLAVYAIAITEEYMFRGVVLRLFLRRVTPLHAIVATNALFALCHMFGHMVPLEKAFYFVTLMLLGSLLSVAALRTGQLWYSIGFHGTLIFLSMIKDTFGLLKLEPGPFQFVFGVHCNAMAGVFSITLFTACLIFVHSAMKKEEADGGREAERPGSPGLLEPLS